jgi:hypothetical protein
VNHPDGVLVPSVAHSRSSTTPCAPSAPRAPLASLTTVDLWVELEHRRSGEDSRIIIEHRRERRCNIDGDLGAVDTTPVKQIAHTPTSPGSWGGCMALAPYVHMVVWPCKLWPHLLEK